jgi:hypothetical protein
LSSSPVAIVAVVVSRCVVARCAVAIVFVVARCHSCCPRHHCQLCCRYRRRH